MKVGHVIRSFEFGALVSHVIRSFEFSALVGHVIMLRNGHESRSFE